MNIEKGKVIVHLVHGTWPYMSVPRGEAWFDPQSKFRQEISKLLPENILIEAFHWTGKTTSGSALLRHTLSVTTWPTKLRKIRALPTLSWLIVTEARLLANHFP